MFGPEKTAVEQKNKARVWSGAIGQSDKLRPTFDLVQDLEEYWRHNAAFGDELLKAWADKAPSDPWMMSPCRPLRPHHP